MNIEHGARPSITQNNENLMIPFWKILNKHCIYFSHYYARYYRYKIYIEAPIKTHKLVSRRHTAVGHRNFYPSRLPTLNFLHNHTAQDSHLQRRHTLMQSHHAITNFHSPCDTLSIDLCHIAHTYNHNGSV